MISFLYEVFVVMVLTILTCVIMFGGLAAIVYVIYRFGLGILNIFKRIF